MDYFVLSGMLEGSAISYLKTADPFYCVLIIENRGSTIDNRENCFGSFIDWTSPH